MISSLTSALASTLGLFDDEQRLYRLDSPCAELAGLHVQAWALREALSRPWELQLLAVSETQGLDLQTLLGQPLTLVTRLADGSEQRRTGQVLQAAAEDSDGGLARYQFTVQPWLGFLDQTLRSQVWQDTLLTDLIDSVLGRYAAWASWRWAPCVGEHLGASAQAGVRPYTVQYRETDLAFLQRLLAREGLAYRFEESEDGQPGPTVVFFADSTASQSCPEDAGSAAWGGVRFHRDGVQEGQDTIQAFGGQRQQAVAVLSATRYDPEQARLVAAEVATAGSVGGENAPWLETYESLGESGHGALLADSGQLQRSLTLAQQAIEARHKSWLGRSVVRSFSAGQRFALTDSPLDALDDLRPEEDKQFLLTELTHAGLNNLPKDLAETLARQFQPWGGRRRHDPLAEFWPEWLEPALIRQAQARGYANAFAAIRAHIPWRPLWVDEHGQCLYPRAVAPGPLLATVVGPDGSTTPQGDQEVHTDRLGRVRIRYEFQGQEDNAPGTALASPWVRVLQPLAGEGQGLQWTPRIGHEVLVGHVDDDLEQPIILCGLYHGRGEGGVPATPGGQGAEADTSSFASSSDANPSAQGNLSGGNSPAWHGGAPGELSQGGQRNAAALSGYKSKEFGGSGYNQLVFDDSDGQLRVQLASTQHASQLNLGHLIHQADNHRGSFRGTGWELRTDAYGAVRARQGLLISTFGTQAAEPAGDNAAGIALARQLGTLSQTFSQAAATHQTVAFSGQLGSAQAGQSLVDPKAAPIPAWLTQVSGMVSAQDADQAQADAAGKNTQADDDKLPHSTDAIAAISARGGLLQTAAADIVYAAGENIHQASAQDIDQAVAGAWRLHTGQAIGILGGAIQPGSQAAGTGVTLIAGQDPLSIQAQAGTAQLAAQKQLAIQSQSASVNWAAAKKITLATAGGASITLEGGNITFECPGTITVKAGTKSFEGGEKVDHPMPVMPQQVCVACLLKAASVGAPFALG